MFIEKLTEEQILELARYMVGSYKSYRIITHSHPLRLDGFKMRECRLCSYELKYCDYPITNYIDISDFESRNGNEYKLVNYMYKVFGEEYKQAYLEYQMSIFEE